MSETLDLTMLGGTLSEIARDLRLLRLQVDNIAGRLMAQDTRSAGVDGRLAALEQSMHELLGEIARGFGQQQQQITRLEKRLDVVDAGLTGLRSELAASTERILAAIGAR